MMHKGNVLQMITTLFRNQNIVSSKKKHFTSNVTHFSQHFNLIISCDKCRPWITCLSTTITSCDIYTQNRIQKNNMDTRIKCSNCLFNKTILTNCKMKISPLFLSEYNTFVNNTLYHKNLDETKAKK